MLNILNNYIFIMFLLGLALSNNLILFFISWVGLNMALYAILLKSYNSYSVEMTLKYFISGAIVTIFLLISILFYYIEFFNFSHVISNYITFYSYGGSNCSTSNYLKDVQAPAIATFSKIQKYFYITLLTSIIFKLGSFPFHFYLIEIYESLCIRKSMFMYTIFLKVIMFFTLIRIIINFWYLNDVLVVMLSYSGIGSLLVSSFSSIKQLRLRKIFAYSYLNAIGLVLITLAYCNCENLGMVAISISKYYFFSYIITWFGIWNILMSYSSIFKKSSIFNRLDYISDLLLVYDIKLKYVRIVMCLLIFILSLAGLPPLLGFFTKALVFFSLSSSKLSIVFLFFCLLTTPIMSFTYLRLIIFIVTSLLQKNIFEMRVSEIRELFVNYDRPIYNPDALWLMRYTQNSFNYSLSMLKFCKIDKILKNSHTDNRNMRFLKKRYLINILFNYKTCAVFILLSPIFFII